MGLGNRWIVSLLVVFAVACTSAPEEPGKIPITTSSEEARDLFLEGRDLVDNLRLEESRALFDAALEKDPDFAMAHLFRSHTKGSTAEFFDHLNKAVAQADKVSEGERLWILGKQAGADGDVKKQTMYWQTLVAKYPDDKRAHMQIAIHYTGLQNFEAAIGQYRKAIELAPDYAPAYNQIGYSLRSLEKYQEAEEAFRKYTELIPDEPNPYDSLGELLMKIGRFDESIETYRKALSINPDFNASYIGIAANLMYKDEHGKARETLRKLYDQPRTDGDRRHAISLMAITYVDEGDYAAAMEQLRSAAALAEKSGDKGALSHDANVRGQLLLWQGKAAEAAAEFDRALELARESVLSDQIKKNIEISHHGSLALLAAAKRDFESAKKEAEKMQAGFEGGGNPYQMRSVHEVMGRIALAEDRYEDAIQQFYQANQFSPHVLYLMAQAHEGKGQAKKAQWYYEKAANHHALPKLEYALIRKSARKKITSR